MHIHSHNIWETKPICKICLPQFFRDFAFTSSEKWKISDLRNVNFEFWNLFLAGFLCFDKLLANHYLASFWCSLMWGRIEINQKKIQINLFFQYILPVLKYLLKCLKIPPILRVLDTVFETHNMQSLTYASN